MKGLSARGNIISRSDYFQTVALSTTPVYLDVPAGGRHVVFGGSGNFAVAYGATSVTYPAATSTAGSTVGPELNPLARDLQSTLHTTGLAIVGPSAGAGFVTLAWYSNGG